MPEDTLLLTQYAEAKSETAFAEVVRRHLDLVYSAALRRVGGDHHRATEITQEVFLSLARHARALARHPALAAWLHVSTRNAAANLRRSEQRRAHRTEQAQAMHDLHPALPSSTAWENVRPVLDETLDELTDRERQAVILRFFANQSYAEVGAALALREDAARKQVARALGKLHQLLVRKGITSTENALAEAMTENAVLAAPSGVTALVMSHALAGAATGGSFTFLRFTGATLAKAGLVAVIAAGGVGLLVFGRSQRPDATSAVATAPQTPTAVPMKSGVSAAPLTAAPPAESAEAELVRALAYDQGTSAKRDARLAAEWYQRAAAHGSAAAEFRLGYFCEIGDGLPQSYPEARAHYQRAIALGLASAHLRLGILDLEGWGGPRDLPSAVQHVTVAAKSGDRAAQRVLSGMYFSGTGVAADLHQALAWQTEAARGDDPAAETAVGAMLALLNQQNASLAQEWYQLSAEQNFTDGMLGMASTFLRPGASPEQVEQGRKWLELAADNGNGSAAFFLAGIELINLPYAARPETAARAKKLLEQARDKGEVAAADVLQLAPSTSLAAAFRYVMTVPSADRYVARAALAAVNAKPDAHGFLQPVIIKSVQPVYPLALQLTGNQGQVLIDFVVDTTGRPRRIKAVEASHPGFADAAVRAVEGWRFTPAQKKGQIVEAHLRVPVVFHLSSVANQDQPIRCEIQSTNYVPFTGSYVAFDTAAGKAGGQKNLPPGEILVALKLISVAPLNYRAARAVVTTGEDETGANLNFAAPRPLYQTAVGMISPEALTSTPPRPLEAIRLTPPESGAKTLRVLDGKVEMAMPELDPNATVTIAGIFSRLTVPLDAPALKAEGITLVVYDRPTSEKYRTAPFGAGGPQDYDAGPMFGSWAGEAAYAEFPPAVAHALAEQAARRTMAMKDTELAVGISDPQGHLLDIEFRTKDGQPLRYNHNGDYHSSGMPGKPDRRFDVYDFGGPIPPDTQLVCRVATRWAILTVPFHFTDVPLPARHPL